jgi:hypothetical protein
MSAYSPKRVIRFCARRARRSCTITSPTCGSMLTLAVFSREHIFLEFGSLVLSGADIPSECFDLAVKLYARHDGLPANRSHRLPKTLGRATSMLGFQSQNYQPRTPSSPTHISPSTFVSMR